MSWKQIWIKTFPSLIGQIALCTAGYCLGGRIGLGIATLIIFLVQVFG